MEAVQARGTERLVLRIGAISATSRTVLTPSGSGAVNAVSWTLKEEASSRSRGWRRHVPSAAPGGSVDLTVTVSGQGWQHTETIGSITREEAGTVRARVTQARMLALRSVVWSLPTTVPASTVPARPVQAPAGLVAPAR